MSDAAIILVVDDSIGVQSAAREALSGLAGVEVVCRGDAEEAESWLANHAPAAILCDVVLPGRNGYDMCRRAKAAAGAGGCPILLLSSPFEPFDEVEASACGADGVLGKPFTAAELRDRLASYLPAPPVVVPTRAPDAATEPEAQVLADTPSDTLAAVETADLVDAPGTSPALEDALAARLIEPLAERLAETLFRRLLTHWQRGAMPEFIERSITAVAERLVRQRLQELEDEESSESYPSEDAD